MPEGLRRKRYSSDLDDAEWAIVKPLIPAIRKKGFGTEGKWHRRDIVDAIFYVTKSGCVHVARYSRRPAAQTAADEL